MIMIVMIFIFRLLLASSIALAESAIPTTYPEELDQNISHTSGVIVDSSSNGGPACQSCAVAPDNLRVVNDSQNNGQKTQPTSPYDLVH